MTEINKMNAKHALIFDQWIPVLLAVIFAAVTNPDFFPTHPAYAYDPCGKVHYGLDEQA
jgi:hypothetical protein